MIESTPRRNKTGFIDRAARKSEGRFGAINLKIKKKATMVNGHPIANFTNNVIFSFMD